MENFKSEALKLFSEHFKIGDKFIAIKDESAKYCDYNEDDICELMEIAFSDLHLPFKYYNLNTNEYFWISLKKIFDFEKIGE